MLKYRYFFLLCLISLISFTGQIFNATKIVTDNADDTENFSKIVLYAIQKNDPEKVKLLLEKEMQVNIDGKEYTVKLSRFLFDSIKPITLLHHAARSNSLESAKLLISHNADVNALNSFLETPLHIAAKNNYPEIASLLIDNKANIDVTSKGNVTALHIAAISNSLDTAKVLLASKANIEGMSNNSTPLLSAVLYNKLDMVKLLIDNKSNIEFMNQQGYTPLNTAAEKNFFEVAQLLLTTGANVNAVSSSLLTPIHVATKNNNPMIIKLLVDNKANIEYKNKFGITPLHNAAINGTFESAKALIAAGANINSVTENLHTPLHGAASHNKPIIIKLLLENKANIEAKSNFGGTPLHITGFNSLEAAQTLIESKADLESRNNDLETPLHWGIKHNQRDSVKLLLENKANIEAKDKNEYTALHLAVVNNNKESVKLLLNFGADPNCLAMGLTPLHMACYSNGIDIVRELLKFGADINSFTQKKGTPLFQAISKNNINMVKVLLRHNVARKLVQPQYITDYKIGAKTDGKVDIYNLLQTQDNVEKYKSDIILSFFGLKHGGITFIKPDYSKLKNLMKVCTIAIKVDDAKNNLIHILISEDLNETTIELIGKLIAVNPDLLYLPNKYGITPIDIACTTSYRKLDFLALLFKIAFGDAYRQMTRDGSRLTSSLISSSSSPISSKDKDNSEKRIRV